MLAVMVFCKMTSSKFWLMSKIIEAVFLCNLSTELHESSPFYMQAVSYKQEGYSQDKSVWMPLIQTSLSVQITFKSGIAFKYMRTMSIWKGMVM